MPEPWSVSTKMVSGIGEADTPFSRWFTLSIPTPAVGSALCGPLPLHPPPRLCRNTEELCHWSPEGPMEAGD